MDDIVFNWKRFWCQFGKDYKTFDDGFLVDPEHSFWGSINEHLITLSSLRHEPCLVLLGEPGMGKSKVIEEEVADLKQSCDDDTAVHDLRLGDFGSDVALHNHFADDPVFQEWEKGKSKLFLFLDALDEGMSRSTAIVPYLERLFARVDQSRLYLRIVCRMAAWPSTFEKSLITLWPDGDMKKFHLTILKKDDVREAAAKKGIDDPNRFITEVISKAAVPMAAKPITLFFLIRNFQKSGSLPNTQ